MADVGYRLKVEGEQEFTAALKGITNEVKLNKAEIALLTEEYNKNGGSVETLAKKSEQLDKAVDNQKSKVAAMKAMYDEASKTIDGSDARMVKLATDIAKQETELVKLTAAQKENEAALKAASSGVAAYDESIDQLDRMLAQSQAELAKLDEQMQTVSGSAGDAARSQEELAKAAEQTAEKQEIMSRAVEAQRSKVAELQKAVDASASAYGDSAKETDKYRLELTKAETELNKMEKELGEAAQAAKQADDAMQGVGDSLPGATSNAEALGGVFGDIGGKVGGILDQIGVQLPSGLTSAIGQFGAMAGAAAAVVTAVANIVDEMNRARDEAANYIDDLNTTASIADLPTETIQEWQYMSESVDVSVDTIVKSLQKLKETMRDVTAQNGTFIQIGEKIIPIYDEQTGQLRDLNEVFLDTLDGLKGIDDYLERDAASMAVFGKKANELNPLLDQSRQNIDAMRQAAHDYGYVTNEAAQSALTKYKDIQDGIVKTKEAYERNSAAYRQMQAHAGEYSRAELMAVRAAKGESEKAYASYLWQSDKILDKIKAVWHQISVAQREAGMALSGYASGTPNAPAGLAVVGERGTEIVRNQRAALRAASPLAAAIERATGGMYTAVGEGGPEIAYLRGGERIYPHGVIPYDLQRLGITSAIKGYASGIASAPSGVALVGERGTEIVGLGGSRGGAVNNYYDVRIDADRIQELNDIVRIAESEKRLRRMGYSTGR